MPPFHDPDHLERRIYFYRSTQIAAVARGSGPAFDVRPSLREITRVSATDSRYLETGERVTCCFLDSAGPRPRLRVANIRRSDLPQVETAGALAPLPIGDRSGLAEQVHVVCFDDSVLGAVFNFHGPRLGRLAEYLHRKCGAPPIYIDGLLRPDVLAELDHLGALNMLPLRLNRDSIDEVRHIDQSLAAALDFTAEWGGSPDVEIVLRKQAYSRESLPDRVRAAVRRLAGSEEVRHAARAFRVSGPSRDTGDIDEVDVLKSDLVVTRAILRASPRLRALDDEAAYEAIEQAYEDLRPEIGAAAVVGLR